MFATLSKAALYYSTVTPKYQEVTVDLSTAQEGDIVQLPENGVLVDFYVAKLNYESSLNGAGRTLVVRKDCYDNRAWDSGNVNAYASSDLDSWFNSTYKNMLDADIRSLIGTTKIRYTPGNGNNTVGTLERGIFALSATELGQSASWLNVEGSALPIANTLKVAYLNGRANTQWTRSPYTGDTNFAVCLVSGGSVNYYYCYNSYGSRPCFTLPSTFTATYYVDSSGTIHDEQEYEEAGSTTDVKGNPITIGAQIATGSYVGTGTYGASNPNILTFEFEPKFIFIAAVDSSYWGLFNTLILSSEYDSPGYAVLGGNPIVNTASMAKLDKNTNTLSWYLNGTNVNLQLNSSGITYHYVAIG